MKYEDAKEGMEVSYCRKFTDAYPDLKDEAPEFDTLYGDNLERLRLGTKGVIKRIEASHTPSGKINKLPFNVLWDGNKNTVHMSPGEIEPVIFIADKEGNYW